MSGRYNGDRIIQKYDDDLRLCLRVRGDVVMDDDDRTVRAMGRDAWLIIESEDDVLHRLLITEGSSGIEYAWRRRRTGAGLRCRGSRMGGPHVHDSERIRRGGPHSR